MAIGDGENDVEMLELASLGVALSNGSDKAKAVADIIGASNDEDGVADAIYRYAFWACTRASVCTYYFSLIMTSLQGEDFTVNSPDKQIAFF